MSIGLLSSSFQEESNSLLLPVLSVTGRRSANTDNNNQLSDRKAKTETAGELVTSATGNKGLVDSILYTELKAEETRTRCAGQSADRR